jgi:hypothetical protein
MALSREQTITILNAIRDDASTAYQDRIPVATRTNIDALKAGMTTYTTLTQEFTNILINKIGLTLFSDKLFKNKLASFKKGELVAASDVEEIFVELIQGVAYDPEGLNVLARKKPDNIHVMYHRQNRESLYELTISDKQVRTAFRSLSGVADFISAQVQAMYSGANLDDYVLTKQLLANYATLPKDGGGTENGYAIYDVSPITDATSAKAFVKAVKKGVQDMTFPAKNLNYAGVNTWCECGECVLFINKDVNIEVTTEVLATAFNRGDLELKVSQIVLDDFGTLEDTYAILVDRDFFRIFDTLHNVESMRNPKGMFTNYFLNVQGILSLSKFRNAIQFKACPQTTAIAVTGTGGATTIAVDGGTLQMLAATTPANASQAVKWTVTAGTGTASISADGILTALTNGTVTVTATANDGSGITGTRVITLSNQV